MNFTVSITVRRIFQDAVEDAKKRNHEFVTPEHLLWAIMFNPKALELFTLSGSDLGYIHDNLNTYLENKIPVRTQNNRAEPIQTVGLQNVFERAILNCNAAEKPVIGINDIIVSLMDEEKNHCSFFMKQSGIDRLRLLQLVSSPDFYDDGKTKSAYEQTEDVQENPALKEGSTPNNVEEKNAPEHDKNKAQKTYLERFTVNLTEKARKGRLSPIIGREEEIERTIQILCRKQKNNPIHVGGAGVGKTAITEGLAQRITANKVPSFLKNANIYSLSLSDLLAGAKFRGDFEERLKRIVMEVSKEKNAILFIDEIHTVVNANSGGGGIEAPDLLKPILSNGKVRCIGATTFEEYNKYFTKDAALARRFQKIDIEEPNEEEAVKILKGLRETYENFHKVHYSDEVLESAVHLSALHIRDRFLPDKAIDLIDEAGALIKIRADKEKNENEADEKSLEERTLPEVSLSDIDKIVAKTAKIPEQRVSVNETEKLRHFEEILSKKIFGQDTAIEGVTKAVKRSRAGFRSKDKPVANFLFVGPTGVGKTELAKTLAEELGIPLLRFDMSEYQEKHTVSRLIGSPPGYVGFEEGGLLTSAVQKSPNAVLLLDEIEKAHADIYNILLQIMDYATLTDNQGRKAAFNNIILIMTSNAGSSNIGKPLIGFGGERISESAVDEAVEKTFTPEFRNRLDAIIKFGPLTMQVMSLIIKKEVEKIRSQLAEKEISLELEEDVIPLLAEKGYSEEFGARNAARLVEDEFVTPLTDMILFGETKKGSSVKCRIGDKTKKPYLVLSVK
ncbi:ATP-dependent Clp protease ATP-binding subunit ClpA [Treponema sp. OMZ 799]|uniref:ATP-dependent Clp protease ATP-binding subunit ClpA n=1 Tax=Treponema sp. OMZ 799 TaxID=2563668 RepID=UPI0020A29942|nr:ATP-dependent Clp protease ATP-binding subunit ClpA [Treponema sp. OMZ 799]UTC78486.1 ATP-dependent Clp protease ATP-binding subunit ClpA [Treponema sp. OMZ 799]